MERRYQVFGSSHSKTFRKSVSKSFRPCLS